jgi:DedD protein
VGAFSDEAKLKEVRDTLEKAGLHTYTSPVVVQNVKTTRVRLGPYPNKEEANKWAAKVKALNLQANVFKLP